MKIYDYADLNGKRSWDYKDGNTPEDDRIRPIMITDKEINIGEPLIIDGTAYCVCCISAKKNEKQYACVEKLKEQEVFTKDVEPKERLYTNNVICPYCGYENVDSWECEDDEEACECGCCGSIFAYQRKVAIEYCSQPVKKANAICLN